MHRVYGRASFIYNNKIHIKEQKKINKVKSYYTYTYLEVDILVEKKAFWKCYCGWLKRNNALMTNDKELICLEYLNMCIVHREFSKIYTLVM